MKQLIHDFFGAIVFVALLIGIGVISLIIYSLMVLAGANQRILGKTIERLPSATYWDVSVVSTFPSGATWGEIDFITQEKPDSVFNYYHDYLISRGWRKSEKQRFYYTKMIAGSEYSIRLRHSYNIYSTLISDMEWHFVIYKNYSYGEPSYD